MTQNLTRRVGINTGLAFSSEMLRKLLALLLQLLAVRVFGDAGYGRYSFALGFVALWALGNDLGLAELTVRDVARKAKEASAYLSNILVLKLLFGALTLLAVNLVGQLTQPSEGFLILWAGLAMILFGGSREAALGVFKGSQDFRSLFFINLSGDLLSLGLGFTAVLLGYGPEGLIVATALSQLLSAVVGLLWARKRFGLVKPEPRRWGKLLRSGIPFALASAFIIIYKQLDITMLKYILADDAVVGWYSASVRLINMLLFVPVALSAALFPAMAEISNDRPRLSRITESIIRLLTALALPAALLFFFHSGAIGSLLLGEGYAPAADSLRVLAMSLPLVFAGYPLAVLLKSAGGEKRFALAALIGGVFNFVTNLWAIPRWQHVGAAITTVASELLVLVLFIFLSRKYLEELKLTRPLLGLLVSGAAFGAACWLLPFWAALLALPGYLALLFVTGVVGKDELTRLKSAIKK